MKKIKPLGRLLVGVVLAIVLFMLAVPNSGEAAPGDLDPTFGSGGKVISDFGDSDAAAALAIQPDGKIVVAGKSGGNFALARYLPDGNLDPTFGTGGNVITDFGTVKTINDGALAIALQPDGKIVVAGNAGFDVALARYNPDGSPDITFGSAGKVTTDFGDTEDFAEAIALQDDGKIVVAGHQRVEVVMPPVIILVNNFALARYNPDGSLDTTFGSGGRVITDFGSLSDEGAEAVALQPDGKIVVAGFASGGAALVRYNPDGSPDPTFGNGGNVMTGQFDVATALALQPDGKLVVAGWSGGFPFTSSDFALARYNPDGSLDATFGSGGTVITDFGPIDAAEAIVLQPDGKLVVAGSSCSLGLCDFALARYNSNGSSDSTLGSGGKVATDFGALDRAHALALQLDGKIVVAGFSAISGSGNFALARYKGDPLPTVSIATNQPLYHAGDRMIVTVTTDPAETTDRWYLVVALVTPVNTPTELFFIYRFNPVVELLPLQAALARPMADIAARPLSVVAAESFTILDLTLPALPVGAYQWLTAFFSENLSRISIVAGASLSFE